MFRNLDKVTSGLQAKLKKIAPTPNQMVDLLFSVRSLGYLNTVEFSQDTVFGKFIDGEFGRSWALLSDTAKQTFKPKSAKFQEFKDLIIQYGVVKVVIALMVMIIKEVREGLS